MPETPWRVLHVVANHEKKVVQHLRSRSLEHYLPLYTEISQWTDRAVNLQRPLFAGYLFARFAPEAASSVVTVPGVLRLLGNGHMGGVPSDEIERLRTSLQQGCHILPHTQVFVGTRVRIRRGIFAGVVGMVTEMRRQCKVVIALSSMEKCFSLETQIDDVETLDNAPLAARY